MTSEFDVAPGLSVRFTNIHPDGGVTVALELLKPIAAINTSLAEVPVGFWIVRVEPEPVADDAVRKVTRECAGETANSNSDRHTKLRRADLIGRPPLGCHSDRRFRA